MARTPARFSFLLLILTVTPLLHGAATPSHPLDLDAATPDELVAAIVEATREGSSASRYIQPAGDRGMASAVVCEPLFVAGGQPMAALCEVVALAGRSRRSNAELLRLYDPIAYGIFYTPGGAADQDKLAATIDADGWPAHFAEAMVHAAPLPALRWMEKQAASPSPHLENMRQLWAQWGWWVRTGNERQHTAAVRHAAAALSANRAILADGPTHAALLRFAGETDTADALDFVIAGLHAPDAESRQEAAIALGRLGEKELPPPQMTRAIDALVAASAKESDGGVLEKLAEAARAWPDSPAVGRALSELFDRAPDFTVRVSILYTAAEANWPQRSPLILHALNSAEDGVPGVALQAVTDRPSGEFVEPMLALLQRLKSTQPSVVDAAGALRDPRATPRLAAWIKTETNPAMRLKLAVALGNIGDKEARAALLDLLGREDNALVMDHLVTIAGQIHLEGSEPLLTSLVEDQTAPLNVRVSAIWSLGHFGTPTVRASLKRWSEASRQFFDDPLNPMLPAGQAERLEQVRIYILMARLRLGDEEAARQLQPLYDHSTPTARLSLLVMLGELKRDDPMIEEGLGSSDLPVLLAAIKAAGAAAPQKYHEQLLALRGSPFLSALMDSGLDTLSFTTTLDKAIAAGGEKKP